MSQPAAASVQINPSQGRRAVVAASLGNVMEWFDIVAYAFMAPVIQVLFFPELPGPIGLMVTFGLVGVAYLIRPIGALVIGNFGDRRGRKAALTLTILLMTVGTLIMAVAPTAATIGAVAPLLIVISRLVQGFSAGGEFGSATAFMTENTERHKAFYGSWQSATQGMSMFLAAGWGFALNTLVSEETLHAWAWRLPFFFGLLIGPIGLWIRRTMPDTPEFQVAEKVRFPLGEVFKRHIGRILVGAMCLGVATMSVYLITYLPTFAQQSLDMPSWTGYAGATVAGLVAFGVSPLVGRIADRVGETRVMLVVATIGLVIAYPMFAVITGTRSVAFFIVAEVVLGLLMAGYFAAVPSLLASLFPTAVRTTGMSIAYNVGVTLIGGFAANWILFLQQGTGRLEAPSFYYMGIAVISIIGLILARRIYHQR